MVFILRTKVMLTTVRGQLQIAAMGLLEREQGPRSGVLPKYQSNDGGTWEGPAQKLELTLSGCRNTLLKRHPL